MKAEFHLQVNNNSISMIRFFREAKLDLLKRMLQIHECIEETFYNIKQQDQETENNKGKVSEKLTNLTFDVEENIDFLNLLRLEVDSIDQRSWLLEDELPMENNISIKDMQGLSAIADDIKNAFGKILQKSKELEKKIASFKRRKISLFATKEDYYYNAVLGFRQKLKKSFASRSLAS